MASQIKFSLFTIFIFVLAMVVAGHDGHVHSPAEAPSSFASSLNCHSVIGGFVPILIAILFARNGL
ncbi:hypothetical protein MtrunA17_Chr5g0414361 [Medicago truncatula]|uniref:Transmembrane protein, putative n=1 Tax=Medicago truncatula TaxID=3880 RepID=G7K468_MEDTR|nr:transmembrane protein, putative [Medicago truncatula]RHN55129.1 hypothetical protein MtrunA17_Chr5g0414361 [Medicago truncatula]